MTLHNQTISPLLQQSLMTLMKSQQLNHFRLANGTALSLQLGHRMSKEIDLYTDREFNEYEFTKVKTQLQNSFGNGEHHQVKWKGEGTSFFIYNLNKDYVKVDVYYSPQAFIRPAIEVDYLRMTPVEEIIAMKLETIRVAGNKSDFWDLHALSHDYSLEDMLALHKERYPETHNRKELLKQLLNFDKVDDDFAPNCLQKKEWGLIKLDLLEFFKG